MVLIFTSFYNQKFQINSLPYSIKTRIYMHQFSLLTDEGYSIAGEINDFHTR